MALHQRYVRAPGHGPKPTQPGPSLLIASVLRHEGSTGVHTHVRELVRYLEATGVRPILVTPFSWGSTLRYPAFGARLLIEQVSTSWSVMWYRTWHELFLYRALDKKLEGVGDAVIYAQGPVEASAALRARRGSHHRVVLVSHSYGSQADEWAAKGKIERGGRVYESIRQLERRVLLAVDAIVHVSEAGRDALLAWLPEAAAVPTAVIPNFVCTPPCDGPRRPLADLVTVGGLELGKNHRYLLQVLAEAKKTGTELTLDVYGSGPCRRAIVQAANDLGVSNQVRLRGFRPEVRDYLPGYRAYVHASTVESFGLALIEAMAAGLPIVAGRVGGIAELYSDGIEGRFWPLDDPEKAAEILVQVLNTEEREVMGAAASERFQGLFESRVVAPRLAEFLLSGAEQDETDIEHPDAVLIGSEHNLPEAG